MPLQNNRFILQRQTKLSSLVALRAYARGELDNVNERVVLSASIKLGTADFRELHGAILECEQCEIATNANISTGMPFSSLLTHEYATGFNGFATKVLDSMAFRL